MFAPSTICYRKRIFILVYYQEAFNHLDSDEQTAFGGFLSLTANTRASVVCPGCVKTRHEISFLKFDRAGCAVSHDRLSGKGRGIP
jgi:hypothetical protein